MELLDFKMYNKGSQNINYNIIGWTVRYFQIRKFHKGILLCL